MADWRQIQARIRKAKNATDAQVKLSELYERTHDAMVAWELATIEEKAERNTEAVKWYTVSAERFRRPEWKKRAEEALTRLGAQVPAPEFKPNVEENTESFHIPATPTAGDETESLSDDLDELAEEAEDAAEPVAETETAAPGSAAADAEALRKKRRRGRRGGRGRRKKTPVTAASLPNQAFAEPSETTSAGPILEPEPPKPVPVKTPAPVKTIELTRLDVRASERSEPVEAPRLQMPLEMPSRRTASERTSQGRAGDPALASRMSRLESMLRRLVSGAPHRLDAADEAPAGPGVFLLSDSDLITSYYVESCQTLRVAIGNLVRGGGGRGPKGPRSGKSYGEDDFKAKLAEHLGINESKVSQYMKEHCLIRWIQLDDDAAHLAHFAIGVLKTPLNVV